MELSKDQPARDDQWDLGTVTNVRWGDPARSFVRAVVSFPNHRGGYTQPHEYVARGDDVMDHGAQLYRDLIAGKYGPIAEYTPDIPQLTAFAKETRSNALNDTDWLLSRHNEQMALHVPTTLTDDQYRALIAYRQELRDITTQTGFPVTIAWPVSPV